MAKDQKKTKVEIELLRLPMECGLKVGSKTGYFYCGTVEDFSTHMDEYSYFCMKRADTLVAKANRRLESAIAADASPSAYVKATLGDPKKSQLSARSYMDFLDAYFRSVDAQTEKAMKARDARAKFHPLRERDVVRLEKSAIEDNCYILVLSGEEFGNYWELSDAKNSNLAFGNEGECDA